MSEQPLSEEEVGRLRLLLGAAQGVDLSYYTESFLTRRVAARIRQFGYLNAGQYITRLETDPAELRALIGALTVNVTEFFRDAAMYEALRAKTIPLLASGLPRRLNIWSAGCATGQEPYTLAMVLDEALAGKAGFSWVIHASDISPRQLDAAQAATYPADAAKNVPQRYKRWFRENADGTVTVDPALKTNIRFHQHDLSAGQPLPIPPADLILCRNVMIYFSVDAKEKLLEFFHKCLAPGGLLVLGGSEVILKDVHFKPLDPKNKIYKAVSKASTGER